MDANQYIAIGLLLGRIICVVILSLVIRKQWRALRSKKYPELRSIRQLNLAGTIVLLVMNFIPILIDALGVFDKGNFATLLAYVFSNNLTAILYSFMLWTGLRLAEKIVLSDNE